MRGFPRHLNSKQDYLNLIGEYPAETRAALTSLLDDRIQWMNTGTLAKEKDGIEDDTHKVIKNENEGEEETYQFELMEDPNAQIFRLGFEVAEVENLLGL